MRKNNFDFFILEWKDIIVGNNTKIFHFLIG